MTTKELAHDLYLGLRDAYHCPEVSITEYEGAMAYRIQKAIDDATEPLKQVIEIRCAQNEELVRMLVFERRRGLFWAALFGLAFGTLLGRSLL